MKRREWEEIRRGKWSRRKEKKVEWEKNRRESMDEGGAEKGGSRT